MSKTWAEECEELCCRRDDKLANELAIKTLRYQIGEANAKLTDMQRQISSQQSQLDVIRSLLTVG